MSEARDFSRVQFTLIPLALDIKKQKEKDRCVIATRCQDVLAAAERTESIIVQEREKYGNLPEEHRAKFLAKYDELEKKVKRIRADVAKIQKSFGIEVAT